MVTLLGSSSWVLLSRITQPFYWLKRKFTAWQIGSLAFLSSKDRAMLLQDSRVESIQPAYLSQPDRTIEIVTSYRYPASQECLSVLIEEESTQGNRNEFFIFRAGPGSTSSLRRTWIGDVGCHYDGYGRLSYGPVRCCTPADLLAGVFKIADLSLKLAK